MNILSQYRVDNYRKCTWLCNPIFAEWIIEMIKPYGKSICDIGCGDGYMLNYYLNNFEKIAAIDPSKKMIEKLKENPKYSSIEVRVACAEELPYKDQCFDIVISKSSMHHFSDINKSLLEMKRIAKKAVIAIEVVTPNEVTLPFAQYITTTKEENRNKKTVFLLSDLKQYFETIVDEFHVLEYDQYIDMEDWIRYSDLTDEMKKEIIKLVKGQTGKIKRDLNIHIRDGHISMLRKMIMLVGFPGEDLDERNKRCF